MSVATFPKDMDSSEWIECMCSMVVAGLGWSGLSHREKTGKCFREQGLVFRAVGSITLGMFRAKLALQA